VANRQIKLLLAEDVKMLRAALVSLLEFEEDLDVVVDLGRGDEIVGAALKHNPDVAIIDIDLPGIDGLTAAADLHERMPACRTLILTSFGRPGTLRRALEAHVSGFILKDAPPATLVAAVRDIHAGRRVIDPQLAMATWDSSENPLSRREIEILRMAARGADPGDIAAHLYLSLGTVRNYLTSIVMKLNARNRVDAIRIASEAGWIP
jgi:two-component system, NarL family, response regulator DesR